MLARPEAARQRAQGAFTMVSFIVGAVITAGLLADIDAQRTIVKVISGPALLARASSVGTLLAAVLTPHYREPRPAEISRQAIIKGIVNRADREAIRLLRRLDAALFLTGAAMALTLAAIAVAVTTGPPKITGAFSLSTTGVGALPPACRRGAHPTLTGNYEPGSLSAPFVEIRVAQRECSGRAAKRPPTVRLRRADVVAVTP